MPENAIYSRLNAGNALGVLCFMSVFVIEFYGVYALSTVTPTTGKKESCPIFAMVLAQVCVLAVTPIVACALGSKDDDWGDFMSAGCVCIASTSAFIASLVVILNKESVECADTMQGALKAFMVVDLAFCIWSGVGWAIITSRIRDHARRMSDTI